LAFVPGGTSFIDKDAPPGLRAHAIRGVIESGLAGPFAFCRVEIDPPSGDVISGRVVFDDGADTPISRGAVIAIDERGERIARAQVDETGRFTIALEDDRAALLEYALDLREGAFGGPSARARIELETERIERADGPFSRGDPEPVIRVPLPVVALATETRAYEMLGAAIGSRAPLYTVGVPAGTGRGAIAL